MLEFVDLISGELKLPQYKGWISPPYQGLLYPPLLHWEIYKRSLGTRNIISGTTFIQIFLTLNLFWLKKEKLQKVNKMEVLFLNISSLYQRTKCHLHLLFFNKRNVFWLLNSIQSLFHRKTNYHAISLFFKWKYK